MLTKHFHQDNTCPHIARVTNNHTKTFRWDTVIHPLYTPRDYYLPPELKKHLGGMNFRTGAELKEEVLSYQPSRCGGRVLQLRHEEHGTLPAKTHCCNSDYVKKSRKVRFLEMC